jgi:rhodanese-related sulfurtransferase
MVNPWSVNYKTSPIRWSIFVLVFVLNSCVIKGQHPKSAQCGDTDFDRKVHSYLSYSIPVIGVKDAYLKKDQVYYLDAREKEEYDVSHIQNAKWVGYEDFTLERVGQIPRQAQIIVYCSIGYRSEKIGEKLVKAGFKQVKNLYGSLFEWINAGYPVVDNQSKVVQNIHTYDQSWSRWVTQKHYRKSH